MSYVNQLLNVLLVCYR